MLSRIVSLGSVSPERMLRGALHRYWRYSRGLTLGAQGVVLDNSSRVLLVRHTYRPGWHFPGGGVERGETAEDALGRELREEAGVELAGQPELYGLFANHAIFPGDHIALFLVRAWRQAEPPSPNREIAEQRMFPLDALPGETSPPTRARLAEIRGLRPRSAHWSPS